MEDIFFDNADFTTFFFMLDFFCVCVTFINLALQMTMECAFVKQFTVLKKQYKVSMKYVQKEKEWPYR